MASSIWVQATRSCTRSSTQAVRSVPVLRHSFAVLATRSNVRSLSSTSRRNSSSAAAKALNANSSTSIDSEVDDRVPFSTLQGIVNSATLKAITVTPFTHTHMSPVQQHVFPLLPDIAEPYVKNATENGPRDLLVKAKTGTGKTMGFLVPAIESRLKALDAHAKAAVADAGVRDDKATMDKARRIFSRTTVGTLIISPTRELATQIATEAKKLTTHHPNIHVQLFVGGESKREQLRAWGRTNHDIVVGTPGRLRDVLMTQPEVSEAMSKAQLLVLDEADTLLDMGFRDDIEAIKDFLPPTPVRQTFLFSATVSRAIQQIARSTLDKNHSFINCVNEDDSPVHAHVNQYHTVLPSAEHQIPHLLRLLAHDQLTNPGHSKVIVFFPTTKMTQLFSSILRDVSKNCLPAGRATKVYEIHSKRSMGQRTNTSDSFRNDKTGASILVTSDVSARGVDYPGVTRVIQVGIPVTAEQYIHRVGRTGRANTQGRGDIVLLPFEIGFISWQLTAVPLKPLTVTELTEQVKNLAHQFDSDPAGYFANKPAPSSTKVSTGRRMSPPVTHNDFAKPLVALADEVELAVRALHSKFDTREVDETFMSLLGYYTTRSGEMRTRKDTVVEALKQWAVEACGLPQAPYVSPQFLAKLGATGGQAGGSRVGRTNGPSWAGRGSVRSRDAGLNRESRNQMPVGFGNQSRGDRGGFGGNRDGGYGANNYGSRDGGNNYGSRNSGSNYGSRDGGSNYGQRDSGKYPAPRTRPGVFSNGEGRSYGGQSEFTTTREGGSPSRSGGSYGRNAGGQGARDRFGGGGGYRDGGSNRDF